MSESSESKHQRVLDIANQYGIDGIDAEYAKTIIDYGDSLARYSALRESDDENARAEQNKLSLRLWELQEKLEEHLKRHLNKRRTH